MGRSSVFSLEQVYRRQLTKTWTDIFDPFIYVKGINPEQPEQVAGPAYGYVAGGDATGGNGLSINQRIDFANDTSGTSQRGNFPTQVEMSGGAGNSSYGYTMGGYDGNSWGGASKVYRVDYANDTATATTKGPLSAGRKYCNSIGNANYGYTGGGYPSSTQSLIDRLDYANDTATASSLGNIFSPGDRAYSTAGNQSYGYFAGGGGYYPRVSTVTRLDYANDGVTTSPRGPLIAVSSNGASAGAGTGNQNFGYFQTNNGYLTTTQVSRVDYGNDTATALSKGPLTADCYMRSATGNISYGYFSGGYQYPVFNFNTIDRIDYANDTATASPKGSLNPGVRRTVGFSAREHGLPNSTNPETPKSAIPALFGNPVGPAHGYFAGGYGYSGNLSLVQRIDFANDTATASNKGNLPVTTKNAAGGSNSTHGYSFGGYYNYGAISSTYRVDYNNDTAAASPKGKLSQAAQLGACVGTSRFGYIGGVNNSAPSPYYSRVDRFDYASDTSTSIADNIFNPGSYATTATGNLTHGYFAGGNNITPSGGTLSVVRRLDYSNDTAATSPKGPLSSGHSYNGATGNINFGYINIHSTDITPLSLTTIITRIQYSNDTATSSPKGNLIYQAGYNKATGSKDYGYWSGGFFTSYQYPNEYKSTVDRLDFANDTTTAVTKGPLSTTSERHAGFGGQQNQFGDAGTLVDKGAEGVFTTQIFPTGPAYGYWGTGNPGNGPGPTYLSLIQRLDYSNDSADAITRSTLASPEGDRRSVASVSSKTHGYWCGGNPGPFSYVDRLDFSNDTAQAVRKGALSAAKYLAAGVGNESHGYIFGGRNPSLPGNVAGRISAVDRIDYANDGVAASPKGPLSATFAYGTAVGNANYGYSGGGYQYPAPNVASSSLDRLDYANDTTAATPKGTLSDGRYNLSATGNADYGWFGGGNTPSTPSSLSSRIDRVDYANDTATATQKGPLGNNRARTGATGSSSFGYWSGGFSYSKIERVDFANDTGTASQRGNLAPFAPAYTGLMDLTTATSGQENGMKARTVITYIPRVRFIDLALEGSPSGGGGGEGGGGDSPTPSGPTGPAFGYQVGGDGYPGTASRIERIDYSNDTATTSNRGYLNNGGRNFVRGGATGNTTHGYTFGGSGYSTISKVDYANDTAAAPTTAYLATPADYMSSVGNNNYAYTGGRPWSYYYYLGKFDYSNDTANEAILSPSGFGPSPSSYGYSATGNQNYGYFAGGSSSSMVRRVDYANDTAQASVRGALSSSAPYSCATGNADYGWVLVGPSWSGQSGINRIDFANDTNTASVRGNLSGASGYRGSVGSNDYGYFCGGWPSYSFVHRVDFANDTGTQSTKGPLSVPMHRQAGFSAQQYGASSVPTPAPEPSPGPTPSPNVVTAPFQPPFPFPVQNYDVPTTGYGYVAGGDARSYVHRIDYANDTATAALRGNLPTRAEDGGGAGNQSYGYTMGGYDGNSWGGASKVYRVDYANDTATASERGPLTSGRKYVHSVGNNNYGYTDGGYPSSTQSRIDRVDYANDTNTATSLGNIFSPGNRGTDTAGNLNYGYWGGGGGYLPRQSTVTRLDYSNDTAPTSPRGPLSHPSSSNVAVGNANYGYWQISYPSSTRTQLDRVDYANDTATALPKGNLTATGYRQTATGNPNYGYFAGGYVWPNNFSTIQRINYNNDTTTASPKGPLTNFTYDAQSFSAHENGLSG